MEILIVATFLILLSPSLHGGYSPDFTKYDRIIKEHKDRFEMKQKGASAIRHSHSGLPEGNAGNETEETGRSSYYGRANGTEYLIPYGPKTKEEQNKDLIPWDSIRRNGQSNHSKLQDFIKVNTSSPVVIEQAYNLMITNVTYCHDCRYWYGVREIINAQVRLPTKDLLIAMKAAETDCDVNRNIGEIFQGRCRRRGPLLYCNGYINLLDKKKYKVNCLPLQHIQRLIVTGHVKVPE
ncbi:hypothetical protein M514_10160 [Trichuris suis]|uniref:Uncharacterized protein n=1 Tax=Trichuris suis TaxID=68888 RepID=A0A085N0C3_9BILA|nr:hypothetical protein M514_10160 [Trichuris suis]